MKGNNSIGRPVSPRAVSRGAACRRVRAWGPSRGEASEFITGLTAMDRCRPRKAGRWGPAGQLGCPALKKPPPLQIAGSVPRQHL